MGVIDHLEEFLVFDISYSITQVSNVESETLENLAHWTKWATKASGC